MRILLKYIIRPIIYPIAEIFLYASISAIIVFLCIALLGDTYGILAVFGSVILWAVIASMISK